MFFLFTLLFSIIFSALSCPPSPMFYTPRDTLSLTEYYSIIEQLENYNYDLLDCNFTLISPKKVINPYKSQLQNNVPLKPFGSFYQRCAACIAVADQIGKVIDHTADQIGTIDKNQSTINDDITRNIADLCSKGFKNYDLRRYDDVSLVTDNLKCTEHINTNMDGSWTKKLRELCSLYTLHMDLEHVSNNYANKTSEIVSNLCQGTGIYRDCLNVEEKLPMDSIKELNKCAPNCSCHVKGDDWPEDE